MERKGKKTNQRPQREPKEFEQRIIDLARVTRVMAGGKRLRFRVCIAIGDNNGKVGVAIGKGSDVSLAVNKAVATARRNMVSIPIVRETIPHEVRVKFGGAKILLKPAPKGTGIKAGGVLRVIFGISGVPNVVGKVLGSNNKINNARALMVALGKFIVKK